jgi:hypothetical protein
MNLLIQELAEQARQYANSMYPSGLDIPKWGPAYHEKFAELIVAECAKACEKNSYLALNGWQRAKQIREHFGVEE